MVASSHLDDIQSTRHDILGGKWQSRKLQVMLQKELATCNLPPANSSEAITSVGAFFGREVGYVSQLRVPEITSARSAAMIS